jgi:hypothetical protein
MSREHDVVTLSGVEYDALLSEAEDAARLREELAALRANGGGTMTRLLPCPFCGSPAEIERGSDYYGKWFNLGCSRHWGNVAPERACIAARMFYMEGERSEDEAAALWNTRAALKEGRDE